MEFTLGHLMGDDHHSEQVKRESNMSSFTARAVLDSLIAFLILFLCT